MEPGCNHKLMGFIRKGETDRSPQDDAQRTNVLASSSLCSQSGPPAPGRENGLIRNTSIPGFRGALYLAGAQSPGGMASGQGLVEVVEIDRRADTACTIWACPPPFARDRAAKLQKDQACASTGCDCARSA